MKKIILITIGTILIGGITLMIIGGETEMVTSQRNQGGTIETIENDVANGGVLIDVRTIEEFRAGYIEGAKNLPLQDIQTGTLPAISKDKPVYVYCRSGNRSAQAAQLLKSAGYQNVIDLGAIDDVADLGGEIVK